MCSRGCRRSRISTCRTRTIGDQGLQRLAKLPNLKALYLTETQVTSGSGRRVPEAASQYVRLLGEASGAARRAADERETRHRGNAMTVRHCGPLARVDAVRVDDGRSAPAGAERRLRIPCSSNRRCFPCSKRRSAAAAMRRLASRRRRACTFRTRTRRRRRFRRSVCRSSSLVDRADASKSLLLTKPTNVDAPYRRRAHQAGLARRANRSRSGSRRWRRRPMRRSPRRCKSLARGEGEAGAEAAGAPPDARQYNNTVRDLLGDYSKPAERFPPEDYVDGFKNQLTGAGHAAAARRDVQHRGRAAGAERVPHRRRQRPRSRASRRRFERSEVPRRVRARASACARSAGR